MITVFYLENVREKAHCRYGRFVNVTDVYPDDVPEWTYARDSVVHGVRECIVHSCAVFVLSRPEANSVWLHCDIEGYTRVSRFSQRGGWWWGWGWGRRGVGGGWCHFSAIQIVKGSNSVGRKGGRANLQDCLKTCSLDARGKTETHS